MKEKGRNLMEKFLAVVGECAGQLRRRMEMRVFGSYKNGVDLNRSSVDLMLIPLHEPDDLGADQERPRGDKRDKGRDLDRDAQAGILEEFCEIVQKQLEARESRLKGFIEEVHLKTNKKIVRLELKLQTSTSQYNQVNISIFHENHNALKVD